MKTIEVKIKVIIDETNYNKMIDALKSVNPTDKSIEDFLERDIYLTLLNSRLFVARSQGRTEYYPDGI